VAGGSVLSRILDAFAAACYRVRRSALARWVFIGLAVFSLGLALFSRPGVVENQAVRDAAISEITISSLWSYVRVTGVLNPSGAYRTQYALGNINLYGSRFVPLVSPNSLDVVYVIDENLPNAAADASITLVAQVVEGVGQQPPLYLQIGYPPNVVLANVLARLGTLLLLSLIVIALVAWLVERFDYAVPLPWSLSQTADVANAPSLLWFGELGRQFNDAYIRSQPAQFNATPHEARFEAIEPRGLWSVSVRRVKLVQLFDVATPYGGMPAARLHFEDERGLHRRGVIAANSLQSRDAVLRVLSLIR
jgi:hypothetical protein